MSAVAMPSVFHWINPSIGIAVGMLLRRSGIRRLVVILRPFVVPGAMNLS
jgi:hypothetical protein